ncbi:permease for cytosine/purines, uracil, thiamine, allantoin-domain-containing protein [Dipodascopsis tothii]|uniref:permease for cytosine/purines, uracil, thiamine, allantoin-domain-containing protein n=1 Tax=Dipodascopsis tothii TaxID=44089 RepID=UPI0034CE125C
MSATDLEKNEHEQDCYLDVSTSHSLTDGKSESNVTQTSVPVKPTLFERVQLFGSKFQMETRGIERVPESERTDKSIWTMGSFWFACNLVVSTISTGTIGISVGMKFWDSLLCTIFFNALGAIPVAWFATFGPKYGLRQMPLSRFWFGYYGVKIFVVLNAISCVGWSAINTIIAAQMLHSLSRNVLPSWAGILIIIFLTFIVTLFGYKIVHAYMKYSWIPTTVIIFIVIARLKISGSFTTGGALGSGSLEAGKVLSYGSALFGSSAGWAPAACDYVVYQPNTVRPWKIFLLTFLGVFVPLTFGNLVGLACMMGTFSNATYSQHFSDNGIGGLLYAILVPDSLNDFGRFCVALLALSTVAGTCPGTYSFGLCMQSLCRVFYRVPRLVWTAIASLLFLGVSIPAYYSFQEYMEDFMGIMGYWDAAYIAIALYEHYVIIERKPADQRYNFSFLTSAGLLPPGLATLIAFASSVAGMVVGMSQTWWTGPLAEKVSGDIGFELTFGFSLLVYAIIRPLEYKKFGR